MHAASNAALSYQSAGRSPLPAGHRVHTDSTRGITGSTALKAHLSVDPDSELIDDIMVTPANVHDADAVDDLLAGHVDDPDKPTIMGDAAYAGADTLDDLTEAGYDVNTKVPPARGSRRTIRQGRLRHRP